MPIDMIGLAIGKVTAEQRGVEPPESTKIGVIGSLLANPLMSFVISRSLADREVAARPAATLGTSTGTVTGSTGGGTTGGGGTTTTPDALTAQIIAVKVAAEEAQTAADDAKASADDAKAAAQKASEDVTKLAETVDAGFKEIKDRLPPPPQGPDVMPTKAAKGPGKAGSD